MSPVLADGDYVVTKQPRHFLAGLLYVVDHSDLGRIVKRLKTSAGDRYTFEGINTESTPSALIGAVEPSRIVGQVVLVIGRSGIRRP